MHGLRELPAEITSKYSEWSSLNKLGQSRVLKTAYIWLFIVPLLSKALARVEPALNIFNQTFVIGVPFSWKLFFLGSLFVSAANIIYSIQCPSIIQDFDNFAEFKEQGRTTNQLIHYFFVTYRKLDKDKKNGIAKFFVETFMNIDVKELNDVIEKTKLNLEPEVQKGSLSKRGYEDNIYLIPMLYAADKEFPWKEGVEADAYWMLRGNANFNASQKSHLLCLVLYVLGLLSFFLVILQNIYFVFEHEFLYFF